MRFSVLGPLEVLDRDGVAVVVRGGTVRTVLAMLVMRAGEPVTTGQLCDAVWGDDPPASAANQFRGCENAQGLLIEGIETDHGSRRVRVAPEIVKG